MQNYKRAPGPLLYSMSNIVKTDFLHILCHLIDSNALSQNLLPLPHRFCTFFPALYWSAILMYFTTMCKPLYRLYYYKCSNVTQSTNHCITCIINTDCIISALSSAALRPEGGNEFSAGGASNYNLCHDFLHCCENISFKPVSWFPSLSMKYWNILLSKFMQGFTYVCVKI